MGHHGTAGTTQARDPRRWWAFTLVGLAFFMVILDATIVLTAIPSIQTDLGFTLPGVQWVLTGYALTFAGLMLFFGSMADLLGRRRVFVVGVGLFVASSLLCGLAWSDAVLIIGRIAQGVSAAIMAPAALSIVTALFPAGSERNKALGIWGGLGGVGATSGLLIGGAITSTFGWEWIFFFNVPLGLGIIVFCPVLLPKSRGDRKDRHLDLWGALTVTAGPVLLTYAVIRAPEHGWLSWQTVLMLGAAAGALVAFTGIEARTPHPLVPLRVFRSRSLVGGNLLMLVVGLTVDGMLFPLTLYAQHVLGHTPMEFGLMSAVMTGMSVIGAFAGQALVTKLGVRPIAIAGMVLLLAGALLLTGVSHDGTFATDMLAGLLIFGPGMGACFVAAQVAALADVAESESGTAAGLVDTVFNLGNAVGVAVATSVAVGVSQTTPSETLDTSSAVDLNIGLQAAFGSAAVFALAGMLVALLILPRHTTPAQGPPTARSTRAD